MNGIRCPHSEQHEYYGIWKELNIPIRTCKFCVAIIEKSLSEIGMGVDGWKHVSLHQECLQ